MNSKHARNHEGEKAQRIRSSCRAMHQSMKNLRRLGLSRSNRDVMLGTLRRYQGYFMYGGALLVSAMAILTLALQVNSTVDRFISHERDEAYSGASVLSANLTMKEAALRDAIVSFELTWPLHLTASEADVERFAARGGRVTLYPTPAYPQWIIGESSAYEDRSSLARYLGAAKRLGEVSAANARARGAEIRTYYIDSERGFATIMPAPFSGTNIGGAHVIDREVRALMSSRFRQFQDDDEPGQARMQWIFPFDNPLTGEQVAVLGSAAYHRGARAQIVLFEFTADELMAPLRDSGFKGTYILVGEGGQPIGRLARSPIDEKLVGSALAAYRKAGLRDDAKGRYGDGVMLFGHPVGDTGWTVLYALSWREMLATLGPPIGGALLVTLIPVAMLWLFLRFFERRVFRPAFEHSKRVFESEHLSRTLIRMAPVGLSIVSLKTGVPLLSSAMVGDIVELTSGRAADLFKAVINRYRAVSAQIDFDTLFDVVHEEIELTDRDGNPLHLAISLAKAWYRHEGVLVIALSDVTQKHALQQQLLDAKLASDSANAAKAAFLAAMSHEIRTPLNAIIGHLELLADSPMSGKQRDRIGIVRTASEGLLVTINDVLDFSKVEAGQLAIDAVEFRVVDVVEHALAIFEPVAGARGIRLFGRYACSIGQRGVGDPDRIAQILNNLLGNAIKFTDAGSVTLHTEVRVQKPESDDVMLVLTVEDTGIGMTDAQRAALFQPFVQADTSIGRKYGGTGLGLALCWQLAHAMNGAIEVESQPGVGSRFTVQVPLRASEADQEAAPRFVGQRILFVSACSEWRDFVVPQLLAWRLTVGVAEDPGQLTDDELATASAVVVYKDGADWTPQAENRLIESARRIVYCESGGPSRPLVLGKLIDLSSHALSGLAKALGQSIATNGDLQPVCVLADADDDGRGLMLSHPYRVLVVEDIEVNRILLKEQLESLGCEVETAADGEKALAVLDRGGWDVVLTDINIPGMNGYEFARAALARRPSLPIIAVTASVTGDELMRCMAAGIVKIVTKPLSLARLRDMLAATADGEDVAEPHSSEARAASMSARVPRHLKNLFRRSGLNLLAALRKGRRAEDVDGMLFALHALKGMLGLFGGRVFARQCGDLENAIRARGIVDIDDMLSDLESSLSAVIE